MGKIRIKTIKTPAGELLLGEYEGQLCLLDWKYRKMRIPIDNRIQSGLRSHYIEEDCALFEQTEKEINEYFHSKREAFSIPLLCIGSDFQKSVWKALMAIPYGKTESYLGLARTLGNEKAVRAVASANGANGISIIIPCHRIIGSNGSLGGYAGGLPAKRKLLDLESQMTFNW